MARRGILLLSLFCLTGCAYTQVLPGSLALALLLTFCAACQPSVYDKRISEFILRWLLDSRNNGDGITGCATQNYTRSFDLSTLDLAATSAGFTLTGEAAGDSFGRVVSGAGDFNGDGIDDFLVSAPTYNTNEGRVYLVFGQTGTNRTDIDMTNLAASDGIVFDAGGAYVLGFYNFSLGAAGDINGDGFDDILIGSFRSPGVVWLVFGKENPTNLTLASLGSDGARFEDLAIGDATYAGTGLGDVNGDGLDDFIVGDYYGPATGRGRSTVVFGTTAGFTGTVDTSSIGGTSGFRITGKANGDYTGPQVSKLGDINGDGLGDILLGDGIFSGSFSGAFVIYGVAGTRSDIVLSALGADGYELSGAGSRWGRGLSGAGDFNGDGQIDFAVSSQANNSSTGRTAILYGDVGALSLGAISAGQGVTLDGPTTGVRSGYALDMTGDVNGDGLHDLLISADRADQNFTDSGSVWLVFGQSGIATTGTTLSSYTGGTTGIRIDGPEAGAYLGREVALADINGDGCADILLGAAYQSGIDSAYVIYGGTAQ